MKLLGIKNRMYELNYWTSLANLILQKKKNNELENIAVETNIKLRGKKDYKLIKTLVTYGTVSCVLTYVKSPRRKVVGKRGIRKVLKEIMVQLEINHNS